MSKRQSKSTRKPAKRAAERRRSKEPRIPPVEKAWFKFVYEFHAFKEIPDDEKNHEAWEKALRVTDKAAYEVMAKPATCLHDIEFKMKAWAFTSGVITKDDITSQNNWQLGNCDDDVDIKFIASLRDDILLIKRLINGANIATGSIITAPPLPDMPKATPYDRWL